MAVPTPTVIFILNTLLFLSFHHYFHLSHSLKITCHPDDLRALKSLFAGLDNHQWKTLNNSAPDNNCCDWFGVTCNSSSSSVSLRNVTTTFFRVTKLELPALKPAGGGGPTFRYLSSSVGLLHELRELNLSGNYLSGALPESLFQLQKLQVLDLEMNDFSGFIPSNIRLPEIRLLNLNGNFLEGQIPLSICSNGSKLHTIKMEDNRLNGTLPVEIGKCDFLQELSLGFNGLSGKFPAELFGLKMLNQLNLRDNRFTGVLDSSIGNLSSLVRLDISQNMFHGNLPEVFDSLSDLQFLLVHSNRFNGTIPITLANSPSIRKLDLRNNSFAGNIELNCSAMTSLTSLDFGSNRFTGFVPGNLAYCANLTSINLARNNFGGGIPDSFKEFHTLSYLSISNAILQNISSALEILQHCKNLTTLVLTKNFFAEELPSNPDLQFRKLRVLIIGNCGLRGSAPLWLKGSPNLQMLDLSWNRLNGTLPDWFGYFENLFYLDLSENYFSGKIPKTLTALKTMITGNTSLEEISPDFQFFVFNLGNRRSPNTEVARFKPTLSLGFNIFTGEIWPEFGNLKELHVFNLGHNKLSGRIPSELSGMSSLEAMDLSYNNLSGTIPSSFVALSFLSEFNVAYNNLHGNIPVRGQFATFPNSSFEGNTGLCFDQRNCCQCGVLQDQQPHEVKNKCDEVMKTFAGVGFVTGFVIAIGIRIIFEYV